MIMILLPNEAVSALFSAAAVALLSRFQDFFYSLNE
jgi:hypothetical protein